MKILILLVGPSGCGKTTLSKQLEDRGGKICSADLYFQKDDEYKFDPTKLKDAHEYCRNQCRYYMLAGRDLIVIDNTNLTNWEREPYIRMAKDCGYFPLLHVVNPTWQPYENVHGVPSEKVQAQINKYEDGLIKMLEILNEKNPY